MKSISSPKKKKMAGNQFVFMEIFFFFFFPLWKANVFENNKSLLFSPGKFYVTHFSLIKEVTMIQ